MLVRYEELCAAPGETTDKILAHAGLSPAGFAVARARSLARLAEPAYYRATLDRDEDRDLAATAGDVAAALGY